MADKNQIVLELQAKTTKLEAALKRVQKETKKADKEVDRMRISTAGLRRSIGALRNNMLLVSFAFGGTFASVNKLIRAYGQQELAERKLQQALGFTSKALLTQASALQQQTTFGDEAIIAVQSLIGAFTKDEEQIKALTIATLDLASAKGMDLTAAADLVSKSFGSATNALSRYGISVDGAVGSNERLENLTKNVANLFGGQASAQADTMTGSIDQMKNAVGDTAETMGALFSPAVIKISNGLTNAAVAASRFFTELRESDIETTIRKLQEMGVVGEGLVNLQEIKLKDDLKELNQTIVKMGGSGKTLESVNAQIAKLTKGAASGGSEQLNKALTDRERISQNILILEKAIASGSEKRIKLIAKEGQGRLEVDAIEAQGRLLTLQNMNVIKNTDEEIAEGIVNKNEKQLREAEILTELLEKLKERRDLEQEIKDLRKEDEDDPEEVVKKEIGALGKLGKAIDKHRGLVTRDSMEIGKLAVSDADAARNAAIDKISAYAMSAAAKAMENTFSSIKNPFIAIPASIAVGALTGAAVGGLADNLKAAQYGMNEVVDEPTMILAGEAGAEQVSITPLESPNIDGVQGGGASVVVNVSGNVLTSDFVEGELADNIREAVRRGTDFGIG